MTDEPFAQPELRAALGTLLADEPAAPPLVDDIARGRAQQRRRRARGGALVGLVAVVAGAVALLGTVRPGPAPAPPGGGSPTATATSGPGQVAAVTAELARLGFTVTAVDESVNLSARRLTQYDVQPTAAASGTVSASLEIWMWHSAQVPGERTALPGVVMSGCDGTRCVQRSSNEQVCRDGACWGRWTATTTSAYADQVPASLVVFLADGTSAVEGVATPPTCNTCSLSRDEPAFLTAEQLTGILLRAAAADAVPTPGPSGSDAALRACRHDDVKLVPAVDPDAGAGTRSVVIEVHARNPEVRCTVSGHPDVLVRDGGSAHLAVVDGSGGGAEEQPILVTQASTPAARFTVSQGRCEALDREPVPALTVTLPGELVGATVELPSGLAPASCPGGDAGSLTLRVSPFEAP